MNEMSSSRCESHSLALIVPLIVTVSLLGIACTKLNPTYCDSETACPDLNTHRCDIETFTCEPVTRSPATERDAGLRDGQIPDMMKHDVTRVDSSADSGPIDYSQFTVLVRLDVVDQFGTPVTTIEKHGFVILVIYVQDQRETPHGVFATYLDIQYDRERLSLSASPVFGSDYVHATQVNAEVPGLLDDLGGTADVDPLGAGEHLLALAIFTANAPGRVSFSASPANDSLRHATLLYFSDEIVPPEEIGFVPVELEIVDTADIP